MRNRATRVGIKYIRKKMPALLHSSRDMYKEQPNPHLFTDHTIVASFSVYVSTKVVEKCAVL